VSRVTVPDRLRRNVLAVWEARGERWLGELPSLVEEVSRGWSLELEQTFSLTFHWVCAARLDDGTPAVLKLAPPGSDDQAAEAESLRAFAGRGAVRLLAEDAARGALLLQRASPGRLLRELVPDRDEEATAAVARVLQQLHAATVPVGGLVPPLARARAAFDRYLRGRADGGPLPGRLVDTAAHLFDELVASAPSSVLVHGDLHHDNVLSDAGSEGGWLAIDPHGWVGDPGFDVGPLLYNPDPSRRSAELLALVPRRVDQLAEALALPSERVVAWGFVMGVLSELWSAEDDARHTPGRPLDVALLLEPRLT
jgi:streptomycin 6-kinase